VKSARHRSSRAPPGGRLMISGVAGTMAMSGSEMLSRYTLALVTVALPAFCTCALIICSPNAISKMPSGSASPVISSDANGRLGICNVAMTVSPFTELPRPGC
jgi:hypothetical protein